VPNATKSMFLDSLKSRYGSVKQLPGSQSLFVLGDNALRVYIRYSRVHPGGRTFYGLRQSDLKQLEGYPAVVCFLWDGQPDPLCIPSSDYELVFASVAPASDGQFKVQVYVQDGNTELYIAQAGRFNVEGDIGWHHLESFVHSGAGLYVPDLSHCQVQTLLGAIGVAKGYDVWIPACDRITLDFDIAKPFDCREQLPYGFESVERVIREIDVMWVDRGSSVPRALYEVEHSTPIYSGLLRFNDVHLVAPALRARNTVVANDSRRDRFVQQLMRPTFRTSGLHESCTFLDYVNVFEWYQRLYDGGSGNGGPADLLTP
jgi:hypothetical protein